MCDASRVGPGFGIYGELPNWVIDLVLAIEQYEEEHPGFISTPERVISPKPDSRDFGGWNWCLGDMLRIVPFDVRTVAQHIKRYREHVAR